MIDYPSAERDESVKESFHGIEVADPYRYFENTEDSRISGFLDKQEELCKQFTKDNENRDLIERFIENSTNYVKRNAPIEFDDYLFYWENSGLQQHKCLYRKSKSDDEIRLILNPNELSENGFLSVSISKFSRNGNLLAYGISEKGSDWNSIHFLDTCEVKKLPDVLVNVKFSTISWMPDDSGIFYSKYDRISDKNAEDLHQKLCFHSIGSDQSSDVLIHEFKNHDTYTTCGYLSHCYSWLLLSVREGCHNNAIYAADMKGFPNNLKIFPVFEKLEYDYDYICNFDEKFVLRTNRDAPNYKLIEVDILSGCMTDYLPEHNQDILSNAKIVYYDYLVLEYISDVKNILKLFSIKSKTFIHEFQLGIGSVTEIVCKLRRSLLYYTFSSFCDPYIIYECDLKNEPFVTKVYFKPNNQNFDSANVIVKQQFYSSRDGKSIPMFIIHNKDMVLNSESPCLLYGYGGFNISIMPSYSLFFLSFLKIFNGCVAVANIRGGGEYGSKWHKDGQLLRKQNVFDDFICAAEFLVQNGYTNSKKLVTYGGSNGGLLVAACMNQRPELFGACIIAVGVLDMLRYHKFTIGHFWKSEYGDPENEMDFKNLLSYSPLHTIKIPKEPNQYPACLVSAADSDDRVVPSHSLKFIAELQHQLRHYAFQSNPLLLHFSRNVGHGAGKPTKKLIEESADKFCFLQKTLNLKVFL